MNQGIDSWMWRSIIIFNFWAFVSFLILGTKFFPTWSASCSVTTGSSFKQCIFRSWKFDSVREEYIMKWVLLHFTLIHIKPKRHLSITMELRRKAWHITTAISRSQISYKPHCVDRTPNTNQDKLDRHDILIYGNGWKLVCYLTFFLIYFFIRTGETLIEYKKGIRVKKGTYFLFSSSLIQKFLEDHKLILLSVICYMQSCTLLVHMNFFVSFLGKLLK